MEDKEKFNVIVLGIIFDPKTKKILIGKRENDPKMPELTWCFPGGELLVGEEIDTTLKNKVKLKTGYDVKNLGTFFSKTYPEKQDFIGIYFLTQVFEGEEKPGDDFVELKWINPNELENYFTTSFHRKLKKFLIDLV